MNLKIAPSILSADFCRLGDQIAAVEQGGADLLHMDVMDGHFVPNISFGMPLIASVRKITRLPLDVHLMVDNPGSLLHGILNAGADSVTVHFEACADTLASILADIRKAHKGAAVSIKPATPPESVYPYLDQLSMVLVMTVEPGFGGQDLIPETLKKVRLLRAECERRHLSTDIEVDGGIHPSNAAHVVACGANVLVAGSAVFAACDPAKAVRSLRKAAAGKM